MSDSVCLCIWVYSLSIIWCKLDLISQIKTLSLPLRWYSFHVQMNSISVYSIMRCIVHCFGNNGVNWLCHLCYQIRCRPLKKHQERMETNPILGVFIIHAVVVCTNTGNPRSCKDKTSWKARTAKYNTKWSTYKHTATSKADWAIWYNYTEWRTTASGSANTSITDRPMWKN